MVTLYDATSFAPLQELRHGAEVLSIAFDGTGGRVATGDRDGWLRVWSAQTGEEIVEPILAHPERRFEEFGLDPDEVSGPRPHQPTTFRIGTTELLFDGTRLFSAGMIVVRQWDFATGSQIGEDLIVTQTDSDGVTVATPPLALGHSNTPGSLVVATERNLFEWTPGSPLVPTASGTQLAIGAVGLATDVDLAASTAVYAQIGSVITVVELGADSPHFVVDSHLAGDATVSISSDERLLAHAADGGIAIWSLRGDGPISRTADARVGWNDGEPVLAGEVTINSAGDIAVGSADSTPSRLLRIEGGGLVELDRTLVEEWDFLWATGENTLLAIPDLAGHDLYVLDRDTLEPRQPPLTTSGFFALHIGPQGYVALANQPPVIDVFDLATNAHVETLDDLEAVAGQAAQVASLGFSPDGTRLVAATRDGVAAVWDTSTWQPVAPFPLSGGSGQVVGAKYAPDGRLVTVADSGVVVVRNADTLQPEGAALISAQDVAGFSHGPFIDPSERYLLTTAQGEPILWSMTERAQIGQPFPNGIGLVASASADARWLVTLWNDRIVLWDLDVDSWVDVACRLAGRNLTLDEWNQFGPNDVPYHATCDRWPADDDTGR